MQISRLILITNGRSHARSRRATNRNNNNTGQHLFHAAVHLAEARRQLCRAAGDLPNAHDFLMLGDALHAAISLLEQRAKRVAA